MKAPFYMVTQRLVIRRYEQADFVQYQRKMADTTMEMDPTYANLVRGIFDSKVRQAPGAAVEFALAAFDIMQERQLVLDMNFVPFRGDETTVTIGYFTMSAYRRRGLMSEALRATLPRLRADFNIMQVRAHIADANTGSQKAARKAGFRRNDTSPGLYIWRART